ncbi:N-acetylglucosamine-6-phosphate deacetylase [[Clostridium] polysaccharolyticum]|uniref:N-acetylglucosamine-6-phosphate deacetylase n=1 Tax=[Clostridium] polysaccharolyticum TaxID=29364 RepID=A0A1I0AZP4_9FIRM|nr:N-acetylglucosamine-6-phosphate deacetylase [[Clostridium] polysaccharolyticum]SES99720.1 N-acetylglucosamine-6-phosphate deacetylase [[Clostridium] polysaccharolyticum]
MKTEIRSGWVYKEDGGFCKGNLTIKGEKIVSFEAERKNQEADQIIDANGCYVIPGLTDLHLHGCNGVDFSDGTVESIEKMVDYERRHGVTAICPAAMTLPRENLLKIAGAVKKYQQKNPDVLGGMNLEGPFIHPERCGAQSEENCLLPSLSLFHELQKVSGNAVKMITIAPELEGAEKFIREASKEIEVSIGHSIANYQEACSGFLAGASCVTHLYNGMNPWNHREPGIPGAAADNPSVMVELICDGNHLHPSVIRGAWKQYGRERIVLISDSTMATGLADGEYTLGGQSVYCKGKKVTLRSGTLAGSASNLMDCVKYLCKELNFPLEDILPCATINPAKVLGLEKKYGSLANGKYANVLVIDQDFSLRDVFYKGNRV